MGAFIGLILLAIALIVGGAMLLVGAEHVKSFIGRRGRTPAATTAAEGVTNGDTTVSKDQLRPYRVAKAKGVARDDRLYGLVFVIAGLGLLWLIPSYMFRSNTPQTYQPPPSYSDTPTYSRKYSLSDSAPSQAVLGVITLVVLIGVFAFLGPETQTKKAAETVQDKRK